MMNFEGLPTEHTDKAKEPRSGEELEMENSQASVLEGMMSLSFTADELVYLRGTILNSGRLPPLENIQEIITDSAQAEGVVAELKTFLNKEQDQKTTERNINKIIDETLDNQ